MKSTDKTYPGGREVVKDVWLAAFAALTFGSIFVVGGFK